MYPELRDAACQLLFPNKRWLFRTLLSFREMIKMKVIEWMGPKRLGNFNFQAFIKLYPILEFVLGSLTIFKDENYSLRVCIFFTVAGIAQMSSY